MAGYIDGSLRAIVFLDGNRNAAFLPLARIPGDAFVHSIPIQTNLCSSTKGLVLFLDDDSSFYHIVDPFRPPTTSDDGYRRYQLRLQVEDETVFTHDPDTPAVLSLDLNSDPDPDPGDEGTIYISCPIDEEGNGNYRFDSFSTLRGWASSGETWPLAGPIIAETATSCGRMAYWLTEARQLVSYDPVDETTTILDLPEGFDLPEGQSHMQLGVTFSERFGLVLVNAGSVALFFLDEEVQEEQVWKPEPVAQLKVEIVDDPNGWNGSGVTERIVCKELPRPLRFESSVMQVLLLIDGRLFSWENDPSPEAMSATTVKPLLYEHEDGDDYTGAMPIVYCNLELL